MDKWLAELEEKYRKTAPFIQTIIPLDDSDAILKKHYYLLYKRRLRAQIRLLRRLAREMLEEAEELEAINVIIDRLLKDKISVEEARSLFPRPKRILNHKEEK